MSTPARLKVAFDTSVLGYAQYGAGGRTGVFRMADSLARGLVDREDCELYFCGAENFQMWVHARAYLKSDPVLSRVPVLSYQSPARVYGFLGRFFWELSKQKQKQIALPARVMRRVLAESLRAMDQRYSPLESEALSDIQVFHSLFFPLPEATRAKVKLKRFLSVCDLINIALPQYSRDQGAFLKTILATLAPDDTAIAISQCTKEDLCSFRRDLSPDKVRVVHLAASSFFKPAASEQVQSAAGRFGLTDRAYFLSVCTLDPRKNMEGLVRAFAHWVRQEKVTDVNLVLCGSLGESTEKVRATVAAEGLSADRVKLLGYVADEDLAPLYSGALGFVYPSFYEGFGLPVLEAMQCGVPVITSYGSALQEIAEGAALLVDPHRRDDIAAALHALYRQESERTRLREQGLERAKLFTWEKSTQSLMAAYRSAI